MTRFAQAQVFSVTMALVLATWLTTLAPVAA